MSNREVMQQALKALEQLDGIDTETECVTIDAGDVITALRTALAQTVQPAEPCVGKDPRCPCQDGDACHYKDCGSTKARPVAQPEQGPTCPECKAAVLYECVACSSNNYPSKPEQEPFLSEAIPATVTAWKMGYEAAKAEMHQDWDLLKETQAALRDAWAIIKKLKAVQAEPLAMRMPEVGDKVICLEDESLGTVESLTAGGSPDIKFDDGSHGTYLLREFAELFGYVAPPQQQAEPSKWRDMVVVSLVREGIDKHKARELADHFAAQPEPMPWRESASDYERGVIDGMQKQAQSSVDKAVNAMTQRSWVGLTDEDKKKIATAAGCTEDDDGHIVTEIFRLAEAKLKERNT